MQLQIESATKGFELKQEELETIKFQLRQSLEDMRQEQFTEVLKRRLDAYPTIYQILQKYNRIWRASDLPLDHKWIKEFLDSILDCNAKYGVLLSQDVYSSFCKLRDILYALESKLANGSVATEEDLEDIDDVISGPLNKERTKRGRGLGTYMKDDFGSYRAIAISTKHA